MRRSSVWLSLFLLFATLSAGCTLGGSPQQLNVTEVPTNTVPPTRTPNVGGDTTQPTALPTLTSQPNAVGSVPTAAVILPPTSRPLPTSTALPISIVILSPVPGSIVSGSVQVLGAASHPQFLQYQIEYGPDPNPGNLWFPATGVSQTPVVNGLLGIWNTTTISDDLYQLRLKVTLRDGTNLATVVNNVRIQNRQPTPIPTATTVPRPIAAFGQSTTNGQSPLVVNFFNQSQGQITGYSWNFGDGSTSSEINPTHTFRNPGIYTVTLTTNGPGGASNVSRQITVQSPSAPVAAFTQDIVSGESPLTVQFRDQSQGEITSREWQFGDGTTSTEVEPSHVFTNVGTYNVILTVTGPGGSSNVRRQITVENPSAPPPNAAFDANITEGEAPLTVDFAVNDTANISTYNWVFGDGNSSGLQDPQHTYTEAGTYTVTLIVTGDGGQDSAEATINVVQPPNAPDVAIAVNPESGEIPLTVQFTISSNGGEISAYSWDFGDGNTSSEAEPLHTYQQQGTYTVQFRAEGPGGIDEDTLSVSAIEPIAAPVANFSSTVIEDDIGLTVQFTSESDGDELSYSWNFGDGSVSEQVNPLHSYSTYDDFDVTLRVSNEAGSDEITQSITLSQILQAAFTSSVTSGTAPLTVNFDSSTSTGNIASYGWTFGDGGMSAEANPQHIYAQPGIYTAVLTLTDADGITTSTAQQDITVSAGLQAAFTPSVISGTAPLTVNFDSSASTGNIASYGWTFGDGGTSAEANPQYSYAQPGIYTAVLTLTDADGITTSTAQQDITVSAGLQAAFTSSVTSGTAPLTVNFDSSTSTGNIASYGWTFGDGGTSAEANPQHIYAQPGIYTAVLTLTDADGITTSTAQQDITVSAGLQAAFTPSVISGTAPLTVNFDSSASTGQISSFLWDFGDGNTTQDPNPQYIYQQAGTYTVTLTLGDVGGGMSTTQTTIEVLPDAEPPDPRFTFVSDRTGSRQIYVMDEDGANVQQLTDIGGSINYPDWGGNERIIFSLDGQLFTMNTDGSDVQAINDPTTGTPFMGTQPSWSPDGTRIAFSSERDGNPEIYVANADGTGLTRLTDDPNADREPNWSPDGTRIAFSSERDGNSEIYIANADGTNAARVTDNPSSDSSPDWLPDSQQVTFVSERDGNPEIYVVDLADPTNPRRITNSGTTDEQPSYKP